MSKRNPTPRPDQDEQDHGQVGLATVIKMAALRCCPASDGEALPDLFWCRRRDSNSHSFRHYPSRWRVYQFHHVGKGPDPIRVT